MRYAVCAMLATTLVLGACPGLLFAQQTDDGRPGEEMSDRERARRVEQLAAEGANAYRSGDFEGAIDFFERAHALEPVPNLLYNIARSYEKQEKYEEAVDYYREFVVAPDVDSDARQTALQRIESLRERADLREDKSPTDDAPRQSDRDAQPVEPSAPAEPANTTAWWTMGGGAALMGAGAAVGLALASPAADDVQSGAPYAERKAARDDARTYALVADGLLVTGAVVTGVGLYLYFSNSEAEVEQAASQAVVSPWLTSSSAGLGMSLDF